MSEDAKLDPAAMRLDEEKLAHALISRGLITRDEYKSLPPGADGAIGPQAILSRLVSAKLLTLGQAKRATRELEALLDQQIPGYAILEKLGQGAMGTVFKARQLSMDRLVAIKVLLPRLCKDPEFLEHFRREAHLAARLSHNNIVQAIDVGSAGKLHYFVMELVEGRTIKQELESGKQYEEREAVEIIVQIAQAVQHASRRGLIHRDIKPANIVITKEGIAKLADLGLARETADVKLARREQGIAIGTPYYMAPEQIESRLDVDARADLYSLGATLYHMVTGQPPFPHKAIDAVLEAHLKEPLTPPDHLNTALSSGFGEVVEIMLAKDCKDRYRTPDDLIIDLECLMAGEPPKLARQKIGVSTLEGLTEGEEEDDRPLRRRKSLLPGGEMLWVAVLAGLLALSVLLNLILIMVRRGS